MPNIDSQCIATLEVQRSDRPACGFSEAIGQVENASITAKSNRRFRLLSGSRMSLHNSLLGFILHPLFGHIDSLSTKRTLDSKFNSTTEHQIKSDAGMMPTCNKTNDVLWATLLEELFNPLLE